MLKFDSIELELKNVIDKYYNKYGERSCQHSFASSFCLKHKYNDMFAEKEGVLYIYRDGISSDNERVYLFPMCDKEDKGLVKNAILEIVNDAHDHRKKVKFQTITKTSKEILDELFGDLFYIEECRDYFEYIYDVDKIASLQGSLYQSKRNIVNKLYKNHNNIVVREISADDKFDLKRVYEEWANTHYNIDENIVSNEIREFEIALNNYDKLELKGIGIYIDNILAGFNFGSIISNDTYDGMVQKGDLKFEGIYELLNRETAKTYQNKIKYMNFEEDLGVEGLRKAKLMYHPAYLLEKYTAKEK